MDGVSSSSRAQLQTWEPSQRGEHWRMRWMSQRGLGELYIDGGGRWHLHQVALPHGGATLGRRPLGKP
jgi:hypothetical protein